MDFGINNKGSGFSLDDEDEEYDSLDSMMNQANSAADDGDGDDSAIFGDSQPYHTPEPIQEQFEEPVKEYEFDNNLESVEDEIDEFIPPLDPIQVEDNILVHKDELSDEDESSLILDESELSNVSYNEEIFVPTIQEYSEPEPAPIVEEPVFVPPPPVQQVKEEPVQTRRQINIRSESDDIELAKKIINIIDVYRKLPNMQKNVVIQFIDVDNVDDEPAIAIRAINVDSMLPRTMVALLEASDYKDRVQRVFYILKLEKDLLYGLGSLVSTISENEITADSEIDYAQSLEEKIDKLDKNIIESVVATQTVLAAAEGE